MTTTNYHKTRITLNDDEHEILAKAITLLRDIWKSAPEDSSLEAETYRAYTDLQSFCKGAELDIENNLYWEEENMTEE